MMAKYTVTGTRVPAQKKPSMPETIRVSLEREKDDANGTLRILSLVTPSQSAARSRLPRAPSGDNAITAAPACQAKPAIFFLPALRTGKNGKLLIDFDTPENMPRSKLMIFAHDRQLNFALFDRNFAATPVVEN